MIWRTKDYKGEPITWYSEDVINRYKSFLNEIRDLKVSQGIKDDVLNMINRFLEESK